MRDPPAMLVRTEFMVTSAPLVAVKRKDKGKEKPLPEVEGACQYPHAGFGIMVIHSEEEDSLYSILDVSNASSLGSIPIHQILLLPNTCNLMLEEPEASTCSTLHSTLPQRTAKRAKNITSLEFIISE